MVQYSAAQYSTWQALGPGTLSGTQIQYVSYSSWMTRVPLHKVLHAYALSPHFPSPTLPSSLTHLQQLLDGGVLEGLGGVQDTLSWPPSHLTPPLPLFPFSPSLTCSSCWMVGFLRGLEECRTPCPGPLSPHSPLPLFPFSPSLTCSSCWMVGFLRGLEECRNRLGLALGVPPRLWRQMAKSTLLKTRGPREASHCTGAQEEWGATGLKGE